MTEDRRPGTELEERKRRAVETLNAIYEVAKRVYDKGKAEARQRESTNRMGDIYGWIGAQVKQRKDLKLILSALVGLERKELYGNPVDDPASYLGGVLRGLEQEREGKALRRGETPSWGNIFDRMAARVKAGKQGAGGREPD